MFKNVYNYKQSVVDGDVYMLHRVMDIGIN